MRKVIVIIWVYTVVDIAGVHLVLVRGLSATAHVHRSLASFNATHRS
jgi:hypothetical protein